jgi:pathogenesis-related protein 1
VLGTPCFIIKSPGGHSYDPNGGRENIAGFFKGVSAPGEGQSMWVDEKVDWNGSTCASGKVCGHYTNMIASGAKEVGCGTASGSGHPYSILVCRYR